MFFSIDVNIFSVTSDEVRRDEKYQTLEMNLILINVLKVWL